MTIQDYINKLNQRYTLGNATEHTFRGDLQQLLESLLKDIQVTNEPKRQRCGAPDYILTKNDIPVGFIEAKDIGNQDLEGKKKTGNKEQFDRYKSSLTNLIFTDYIHFHLYQNGELVTKISIGDIQDGQIIPLPDNFKAFENLITDFSLYISQQIKSPKKLAEMMAGKARLLSDIIEKSLTSDEENHENSTLKEQMLAFKQILIHDITPQGFADVYAQTIAYGMFAARLHDPTLDNFSRQEAAELIPKSNPFLRKLFGYIAGPDIDDRIKWVVENLSEIFLACNVEEILKNYGKSTKMEDPIIHFYETFLSEYDPKLRKSRGVWYTPQPVVNFIVRAVDDILKTEFDLPQGLADTSKTSIKVNTQTTDKRSATGYKQVEQEVHKVQILDPATGTGTFLAEVVKHIHKKFQGQEGIWSNYVETHLLPRLNGFELLMASYAMAHLKLDLLLTETGFKPSVTSSGAEKQQRLRVYLTNSLEEHHQDTGTLFANWLSTEANEANHIKRDTPVMCVIGNPPYAVSSTNKNDWIDNLINDYKKDLNEKSYNSLSDDYVKFIRYGQHYIEKNGSGVLAYISNNSFVDGIVFRKMRENLLECFDKIYILDLHGNSKKKEVCPDGRPDQNVFDIMQGVSINIFVKTDRKKKNELGKLFQFDLYGKRDFKYDFLNNNNLNSFKWNSLAKFEPNFFFVDRNYDGNIKYSKGFSINDLFQQSSSGVETRKDGLVVSYNKEYLNTVIKDFKEKSEEELSVKYNVSNKSRDWKINWAKDDVIKNNPQIRKVDYKPFEQRLIIYTGKTKGINGYPMYNNFKHFLLGDNVGFCLMRKTVNTINYQSVFITKNLMDKNFYGFQTYAFPLYLYPETNCQQSIDQTTARTPNLKAEIVNQIAEKLGLTFTNEAIDSAQGSPKTSFAPIDILDYIYAVLHSPRYREKYKEFLKIDFPRVPYPKNQDTFWQLVKLGGEIRQIHLLESPTVEQYMTQYPIDGDNAVGKPRFVIANDSEAISNNETASSLAVTGKVYINDSQYFDKVSLVAWEFYIGGYQPAQKWLKDRKDRKLEFDDILHYQKIIVALSETDRLMKEIDKITFE